MAKINELFSIRHYGLKKTLIREDDEEEEYICTYTHNSSTPYSWRKNGGSAVILSLFCAQSYENSVS